MPDLMQLSTPTIRPPSSLDMLNTDERDSTSFRLPPPFLGPQMELPDSASYERDSTSLLAPPKPKFDVGLAPPRTSSNTSTLAPPSTTSLPGPDVSTFASQQMANPSRWSNDMIRQGVDIINQESDFSRERGVADMDEFYSSRGLVGSSVEGQGRGDFLTQLQRTKDQRMFDLVREMANTYSQDVQAAGQLGLQARQQELEMTGMNRDDAYRYAVLEQSGSQFQQELGQQESQFARQFGLSGQQLQLEARRLQEQSRLQGRDLDIREATSQAEINLRAQQLVQQARTEGRTLDLAEARLMAENDQFNQSMAQERDQFAAQMGLSREQLGLQREQMTREFGDRQEQRLHEMGLQENTQAFQRAQNELNRMLEREALQLQRDGMDAETAWREADRQIEQRALDLQDRGMSLDDAYRKMLADQQAELSAWDIYLRALVAGAGEQLEIDFPSFTRFFGTGGGTGGGDGGSRPRRRSFNPAPPPLIPPIPTGGGGDTGTGGGTGPYPLIPPSEDWEDTL